ncbi:uncharacterized protein LOC115684485 isoform X1 [Syzygium oleosum]|uniref:uncharacterized protein LOC115684485 isoform X1 n=1 Tax=Syzygium oleosum TaxID=219896 RepID=UPI0024BB791B|nr:uncharacterized protein LOC115684485 isoform X1 [Syzygium oleosum]
MAGHEEEVAMEVEAVQSVYGGDCAVVDQYPPRLHVRIVPRTADVSSQQFVEAVIGISAGPQYPDVPPGVELIESKGLDDIRQKYLLDCILNKARQLSSCSMLVALCEEAVELLSKMNHPEGDCPLCLYPLVPEDTEHLDLAFMKLMSCFHCFHSECIIRWWNWLQNEKQTKVGEMGNEKGLESQGNCPVCRKVFQAKDLEHVLKLISSFSSKSSFEGDVPEENGELLWSDSENSRRQRLETIMKVQQEINGLIEPKKDLVVLPGMYITPTITSSTSGTTNDNIEEQQPRDEAVSLETDSSNALRQQKGKAVASVRNSIGSSNTRGTIEHRNSGTRKNSARNARKPGKHWVRKDDTPRG